MMNKLITKHINEIDNHPKSALFNGNFSINEVITGTFIPILFKVCIILIAIVGYTVILYTIELLSIYLSINASIISTNETG